MASQGKVTQERARFLENSGWTVIYQCLPNSPHIGVVPVPVRIDGEQCYPDILSFKGATLMLTEVEPRLNILTANNIQRRISSQIMTLQNTRFLEEFCNRLSEITSINVPSIRHIEAELVVISVLKDESISALEILSKSNVRTYHAKNATYLLL
jgi:hypothetical protein